MDGADAFMICATWSALQARFVGATKAIEDHDQRGPGGVERIRFLNTAARAALEELRRHEREHGCTPDSEEIKAAGQQRWQEAAKRIQARRSEIKP